MELTAAVEGITRIYSHFTEPVIINLISDSEQALQWCENYFCNSRRKLGSQKHQQLIQRLQQFPFFHYLKTEWVKGHSGVPINELCDIISREESKFKPLTTTIKIQTKYHDQSGKGFWTAWLNYEGKRLTVGGHTEHVPNFCLSLHALNLVLQQFQFNKQLTVQLDSNQIANCLSCAINSDFKNLNLRKSQQQFESYFRVTEQLVQKLDMKVTGPAK